MDEKIFSKSSTIWSRLLRGEENEEQVNQLLAQFQDENALQLNLNSHRSSQPIKSTGDFSSQGLGALNFTGLDEELAARYAKLKAPSPAKPQKKNSELSKINGSDKNPDENRREKGDLEKSATLAVDKKECEGIVGKARVRVLVDEEEEKSLGQDLAARFSALKASSSPVLKSGINEGKVLSEVLGGREFDSLKEAEIGIQKKRSCFSAEVSAGAQEEEACSEAEQVQRLLASVDDSIRLKTTRISGSFKDDEGEDGEDEENLDSEVDKVVQWAKDAARLGLVDSEEEEEDDDNDEEQGNGGHKLSVGRRNGSK